MTDVTRSVLLVDDDAAVREALGQTLELADLTPVLASSVTVAKDHVTRGFPGVVLTDIRMPGRDGFHLMDHVRQVDPELPVILLTGEADVPMAVRAMSDGAFAFLEKPCAPQDLLAVIRQALTARGLVLEERLMKRAQEAGDAAARMLFGQSRQAAELRENARIAARTGAEVLVLGPPGSGVSKVAEVIHLLSPAAAHPFVKRAAAGLDLLGLEDAFASARGGTLFLDDVAALGHAVQFALLEALDGGLDCRVIAGTTRALTPVVEAGDFSGELAMRLDVVQVRIPALSERKDDIPILFRHYVSQACEQADLPEPEISGEMNARLMAQDWPGNARSLMNAAMRFAMGLSEPAPEAELGLSEQLAQVERAILISALQRAGGRAVQAAEALKLPRKTLYDRLARHGLRPEDYRAE